jgi:hypothetical protein
MIAAWLPQTFEEKKKLEGLHDNVVNDIQMSHDKSQMITASKDHTCKVRGHGLCGFAESSLPVIRIPRPVLYEVEACCIILCGRGCCC